jgi:hypothetical protein
MAVHEPPSPVLRVDGTALVGPWLPGDRAAGVAVSGD